VAETNGIRNWMLFKDKDQNKQGGRAKLSAKPRQNEHNQ